MRYLLEVPQGGVSETVDLEQFIALNEMDDGTSAELRALRVGQSVSGGGGAAVAWTIRAVVGTTCTTCGRPVASPFRTYDGAGKVVNGCVAADHDKHLVAGTESARWHSRPEAKRIRGRSSKMWGTEAVS